MRTGSTPGTCGPSVLLQALRANVRCKPKHGGGPRMTDRQAHALWEGSLTGGKGDVELASSGSGRFPVTWASRVERPDGLTSPEELLAASHAACYAMAFSNTLTKGGNPPEQLHVTATVSLDPKEGGGVAVTRSTL